MLFHTFNSYSFSFLVIELSAKPYIQTLWAYLGSLKKYFQSNYSTYEKKDEREKLPARKDKAESVYTVK